MSWAIAAAFGVVNGLYARELFPPDTMFWQQQTYLLANFAVFAFWIASVIDRVRT